MYLTLLTSVCRYTMSLSQMSKKRRKPSSGKMRGPYKQYIRDPSLPIPESTMRYRMNQHSFKVRSKLVDFLVVIFFCLVFL